MSLIIENQNLSELVTLDEAKAQLRLTKSNTMHDDRIVALISAAGELAQTYTNRMLSVGTVTLRLDNPFTQTFLWGGGVEAVSDLFAYDPNVTNQATTLVEGTDGDLELVPIEPINPSLV